MATKTTRLYLPQNLDLEQHLEKYPPGAGISPMHLHYILNQIHKIPGYCKDMELVNGFVPLSATKLKNKIRNYKQCLTYLADTEILECDGYYIVGEKPFGYKFTEQYQVPIHAIDVNSNFFRKSKERLKSEYWSRKKLPYLYQPFTDDAYSIDYTAALDHNQRLYETNVTNGDVNALLKYNHNRYSIDRMANRDYIFHVDDTVNRLHTNLTLMKSDFRHYITISDEPLVSIDISNSQLYLLSLLLNPMFYKRSSIEINIYTINKVLGMSMGLVPGIIMFRNKSYCFDNEDVKLFKKWVSEGSFYRQFQRILLKAYPEGKLYRNMPNYPQPIEIDLTDIKTIKAEVMLILFSSNAYNSANSGETDHLKPEQSDHAIPV